MNKKSPKRFLIIGYGTIGKATLPVLIKEFKLSAEHIQIISADATHTELTQKMGIHITQLALDQTNYREAITPRLAAGEILLILAVLNCFHLQKLNLSAFLAKFWSSLVVTSPIGQSPLSSLKASKA